MADKSLGMRGAKTRRPAIREVAQHAGVAVSSVSRVVSGHPDVSDKMRERVLKAIEELGYVPDLAAQSIRTGATMTIGFPLSDIRNPLLSEIAHAAETRFEKRGYSLLMMSSLHNPDLEVEHLRRLQQRRVDGLLVSVTDERHPETVRQLTTAGVPIVLVDRDIPELAGASAARFDHHTGLASAVEHLVALGHRSIGLVNGSPTVRPSRERARALREIASGIPDLRVQVISGDFSSEHGAKATYDLMSRPDRPTALIAGSNQILVGVLSALGKLPVEVPRDVSLVTCDDVPMAAFVRPRLATIRRDVQAIGHLSAELLLEALDGAPGRSVEHPTTFEPADSCTVPPTATR